MDAKFIDDPVGTGVRIPADLVDDFKSVLGSQSQALYWSSNDRFVAVTKLQRLGEWLKSTFSPDFLRESRIDFTRMKIVCRLNKATTKWNGRRS